MAVRVGRRIEVRLDEEHRAKLAKILEARGGTVSDFVRAAIAQTEDEIALAEWRAAVDELQRTATWTASEEELRALLSEPQCPDLDEGRAS
jgi:uncharacterized protein (DUF1778 family)